MNTKRKLCSTIISALVVTCFFQTLVNCSLRKNIGNRKRIVEKQGIKDKNHNSKPTNSLKLALLEAIEASSNEDFDVVDVMYAVAKTYKDQYHSGVFKPTDEKRHQELSKRKTKEKRRNKRSLRQFNANDAINNFYRIYKQEFSNGTNVPFSSDRKSYDDMFSSPRAEPKASNIFNVPVDDKFLGFLAIPTNQAVAELALKQIEWIAFLFVSHIFDTNASGPDTTAL